MERYENYGCGIRDEHAANHWRPIDIRQIDFTSGEFRGKHIVIDLGGNSTISDDPSKENAKSGARAINYNCHLFENLLNLNSGRPNQHISREELIVMGFYYGKDHPHDTKGRFTKRDIEEIVKCIFLPSLYDKITGTRVSVEEAKRFFGRTTFFTHCQGYTEVHYIFKEIKEQMLQLKYTEDEITAIFNQAFQLSFAPYLKDQDNPTMPLELFIPTIKVQSMIDPYNDRLFSKFKTAYGHALDGIEIKYDTAGKYLNSVNKHFHANSISIYSSQLFNTPQNSNPHKYLIEHELSFINKNDDGTLKNYAYNAYVITRLLEVCLTKMITPSINRRYRPGLDVIATELDELLSQFDSERLRRARLTDIVQI